VYRTADSVWVLSKHRKDILNSAGLTNVVHVGKFFNDSIFNTIDRSLYKNRRLVYAGRIHEIKRLDYLIRAYQELKETFHDLELTLSGFGVGQPDEGRIIELVNKSKYPITKLRWLNHKELANLYKQSDIVVVPSKYETFCSTALEGLACGCSLVINSEMNIRDGQHGIDEWAAPFCINGAKFNLRDKDGWCDYKSLVLALKETLDRTEFKNLTSEIHKKYSYASNIENVAKLFL